MRTHVDSALTPPLLTANLRGIGGVIKRHDEDFIVEEMPLYPASGSGTHTYFTIEKRGLTTPDAIKIVARALGRRPNDIGYAGLKDAHGVTRQRLSIEHVDAGRVEKLDLPRIRILGIERHTNKLKLGHLSRNRFEIKIRQAEEPALDRARAVLNVLAERGVPNYFGPQRFGTRGDNALIGRAVLCDDHSEAIARMLGRPGPLDSGAALRARTRFDAGDYPGASEAWYQVLSEAGRVCRVLAKTDGNVKKAWHAVPHTLRKLYVCAVQSELFNWILARRLERIDRMLQGDLAWIHRNGACFRVEDAEAEQPRCDAFEISPSGPLFGRRLTDARGEPGRMEEAVLAESGLTLEQFSPRDGTRLDGARRPLRVPLGDPSVDAGRDERGPFVHLSFALPPGAYATIVTREICK